MCYIGHPGGLEEYEAVRDLLGSLSPSYWTSSETRLLNRPSAPVLLLLWRRPDAAGGRPPRPARCCYWWQYEPLCRFRPACAAAFAAVHLLLGVPYSMLGVIDWAPSQPGCIHWRVCLLGSAADSVGNNWGRRPTRRTVRHKLQKPVGRCFWVPFLCGMPKSHSIPTAAEQADMVVCWSSSAFWICACIPSGPRLCRCHLRLLLCGANSTVCMLWHNYNSSMFGAVGCLSAHSAAQYRTLFDWGRLSECMFMHACHSSSVA